MQEVLLGDAILSIAEPHAEEYKGEPGDLTSHHLFSGVAVSAIHVGESVLLELHPVFLRARDVRAGLCLLCMKIVEKHNSESSLKILHRFDALLYDVSEKIHPLL